MGTRVQFLIFIIMGVFFCSQGLSVKQNLLVASIDNKGVDCIDKQVFFASSRRELTGSEQKLVTTERDVTTPLTTVPLVNPLSPTIPTPVTNPIATPTAPTITNPLTSPNVGSPASQGKSWCIAVQSASQTALQVALDYACGYGGADCSAIQPGGSCYNPNTPRDHASYAFNNYFQKNPAPTSCNFGGTAIITNIDPSSGGCQYPSTSTSSSVLNTTNPTGATVFGSRPSGSSNSASSMSHRLPLLFILTCLLMSLFLLNH
ncbi:Glucan endo-1,3-beta-glucosidase [Thalictrum thalictroides]|uniref:Glucan endo-1,3-beta-glucosidase n=1 Tax=Thalictrum thalictroides TaxID=46969 RepID=A0A7J6WES0_THATH|nr:Glucan endo-1,3-beta-glucosidase [Thalictrum thalictroides]